MIRFVEQHIASLRCLVLSSNLLVLDDDDWLELLTKLADVTRDKLEYLKVNNPSPNVLGGWDHEWFSIKDCPRIVASDGRNSVASQTLVLGSKRKCRYE